MEVNWICSRGPIAREDVERLEAEWGVKFPDDYVACVLEHNAGSPEPDGVPIPGRGEVQFQLLLDINEPEGPRKRSMRRALKGLGRRLPEGVYPFADESGGNAFCFDFRNAGPHGPRVAFWDHEQISEDEEDRDGALFAVADSFTGLLGLLRGDEDDD